MNLMIVDDNRNFLEGAVFFVEKKLGHKVIGSFESPLLLINSPDIHLADLILIDIEMPELNGIETVKLMLKDYNNIKFIAVTNHTEKAYLLDLICAGFKGCVFKNSLFEALPKALHEVAGNRYYFPNNINVNNVNFNTN